MMEYVDERYYKSHNIISGVDISAYVEGLDDIVFWQKIFRKYAPNIKINFFSYSRDRSLKNGKRFVLSETNLDNISKHFILCVDSDYDYLINNSNFSSPFIFHTYTYSIENYKLSPNGLDSLLQECIYLDSNSISFSFKCFLNKYSRSIYPVFLYILFFERKKEKYRESSEKLLFNKNLIKEIGFTSNNVTIKEAPNFSNIFIQLDEKVSLLIENIEEKYTNISLAEIEKTLEHLAISETEIFWYIQGHLLYDHVIKIILDRLISYYRQKRIDWFNTQHDTDQKNNKRQEYINKTKEVNYKTLLSVNHMECLTFNSCPPLENIRKDIQKYLSVTTKSV